MIATSPDDLLQWLKALAPWVSILVAFGSLIVSFRSSAAASADRIEKLRSDIEAKRANYLRRLSDVDLRSSTNLKECENMRRVILRMKRRAERDVFIRRLADYVRILMQEQARTRNMYARVRELRGSAPAPAITLRTLNEMESIIDKMTDFNLNLDARTSRFITGVNTFVIDCE